MHAILAIHIVHMHSFNSLHQTRSFLNSRLHLFLGLLGLRFIVIKCNTKTLYLFGLCMNMHDMMPVLQQILSAKLRLHLDSNQGGFPHSVSSAAQYHYGIQTHGPDWIFRQFMCMGDRFPCPCSRVYVLAISVMKSW